MPETKVAPKAFERRCSKLSEREIVRERKLFLAKDLKCKVA